MNNECNAISISDFQAMFQAYWSEVTYKIDKIEAGIATLIGKLYIDNDQSKSTTKSFLITKTIDTSISELDKYVIKTFPKVIPIEKVISELEKHEWEYQLIGIENDHYVFEAKILVLDTDSCPYVIKKNVQKSDYDLNSGMWTRL